MEKAIFIILGLFALFSGIPAQTISGPYSLDPGDLSSGYEYGYALAFGERNGNLDLFASAPGGYAVYEWERVAPGSWVLRNKIVSPPNLFSYFGTALAIEGDTLAIGAKYDDRVFIYTRNATNQWNLNTILNSTSSSYFGSSLSFTTRSGNLHLAVGAPRLGTVHVFVRQSGVWTQVLNYTDGNNDFGLAVAFGGSDHLLVGSRRANNSRGAIVHFINSGFSWNYFETIVSPNQTFYFGYDLAGFPNPVSWCAGSYSGPVHILTLNAQSVVPTAFVSNEGTSNYFGYSISFDGNTNLLVVGAPSDSSNASYAGAAYVYSGINLLQTLFPPNVTTPYQYFGYDVAASRSTFAVGAPVFGNGSVYVYEIGGAPTPTTAVTTTTTTGSPSNIVPVPPPPPSPPPPPFATPLVPPPVSSPVTPPVTPSPTPTAPTRPPFGFVSVSVPIRVESFVWVLLFIITLLLID